MNLNTKFLHKNLNHFLVTMNYDDCVTFTSENYSLTIL